MQLTMKKVNFLANSTNTQQFINMLDSYLEKMKCKVYHAPGDANLLVVQKAVESATLHWLMTHIFSFCCAITLTWTYKTYFSDQSQKKDTEKPQVWDFKAVKEQVGPEICSNILFLHTIL